MADLHRGFVQAGDHRLEFFEAGPEGDLTLLLIHGAGSSGRIWRTVQVMLAEVGIRSIAVCTLGAGNSDRTDRPEDYHPSSYARDLVAALPELGIDQLATVGHSLGNATASYVIASVGDRVRAHVNLAGANPWTPARPERDMARAAAGYGRPLDGEALEHWTAQHLGLTEHVRAQLRADIDRNPPERMVGQRPPWPGIEELHRGFEIPVLVVFGDADDVLAPPIPLEYYDELPDAVRHLQVFHGVGHYPNAQVPLQLSETLVRFLARQVG